MDTPDHSREPRCLSCEHATIIQGYAEGQRQIHCNQIAHGRKGLPFLVYECSEYRLKGTMNLHQMESMAVIIENKNGRIGFRPLTREEKGY